MTFNNSANMSWVSTTHIKNRIMELIEERLLDCFESCQTQLSIRNDFKRSSHNFFHGEVSVVCENLTMRIECFRRTTQQDVLTVQNFFGSLSDFWRINQFVLIPLNTHRGNEALKRFVVDGCLDTNTRLSLLGYYRNVINKLSIIKSIVFQQRNICTDKHDVWFPLNQFCHCRGV